MHPDDDPYVLGDGHDHAFWADAVADRILARDPGEPIVIKGGISPSGVPHLGNMNEIVRGYFVAEALRERGYDVRQVFTSDDRDPLRKLPRKLADLDGTIVDLGDVNAGALGENLGAPYTAIPDPFECCDSYGDHFTNLVRESAELLGIDVEMVSNTAAYESGDFEDVTRFLLENRGRARKVLAEYQAKVNDDYVPFRPICGNCGRVTETDAVTSVDLDAGTVEYECTDVEADGKTIEGCGHRGTANLRDGKLPWRFEWPAQWRVLGVDFEPFGKDHAEGSWPSGVDVARNVLGDVPPVPMVYEWFTLDSEAFSSSSGHVILVQDVLQLLEPEVVRFFFSKDPQRARDFSVEHLDQLVDEFDRVERVYHGETDADEDERERAERIYPFLVDDVIPDGSRSDERGGAGLVNEDREVPVDGEDDAPIRIPYTFAAVLGMTDDPDLREEIARREGHIPEGASDEVVDAALARVELAREWARRTDNEFNYDLKRREVPAHDFDDATEAALDDLSDFLERGDPDGDALQGEIYETAKRHDVDVASFFAAGYRLFFDEDQGPKLGQFLVKLDREFVLARLRRQR